MQNVDNSSPLKRGSFKHIGNNTDISHKIISVAHILTPCICPIFFS